MSFWKELTWRGRAGLMGGVLVVVLGVSLAAWWVFRTEYQLLFSELKPQDAQAMTSELERLKIPYRLDDGGAVILVDKNIVHATRLRLMGRELPLQGAVGLELFNNTDFGMTEFAQKINYQRALQGELTRTIRSLSEVGEVRVLLALPEQGLFRQATAKAKASITLSLRKGQILRPEQVAGVQRLVAAAVPGMATQDVTIVDGHGVALTRADPGGSDVEVNAARLDLKRDTEAYLARKVAAVLDRSVGQGQALASVDVTLDMDQIRTTTEDVLPAALRSGLQSTGVIVREHELLRDGGGSDTRAIDTSAPRTGNVQRDVEYAVGHRIEQVVSQPGAIRRVQVVAVLHTALDPAQEEQLRRTLAAAVGASMERGDTVVVQSLVSRAISPLESSVPPTAQDEPSSGEDADVAAAASQASAADSPTWLRWFLGSALVAVLIAWLAYLASRDLSFGVRDASSAGLSHAERAAALSRVLEWLDRPESASAGGPSSTRGKI